MCDQQTATLIQEVVSVAVKADKMFTAFDISKDVKQSAKNQGLPVERHRDMKNEIHREMAQYIDSGLYEKQLIDIGAPIKAFVYYPTGQDPTKYAGGPKPASLPSVAPAQAATTHPKDDDEEEDEEEDEEDEEENDSDDEEEEDEEDEEEEEDTQSNAQPSSPQPSIPAIVPTAASNPCACSGTLHPQCSGACTSACSSLSNRAKGARSINTDRSVDKNGSLTVPANTVRAIGLGTGDKAYVYHDNSSLVVAKTDTTDRIAVLKVDKYHNIRMSKKSLFDAKSYDFEVKNDKIIINHK